MALGGKIRPTQTMVKHQILEDYLASWGGIILSGLKIGSQTICISSMSIALHIGANTTATVQKSCQANLKASHMGLQLSAFVPSMNLLCMPPDGE